jgi:hypothetical protein
MSQAHGQRTGSRGNGQRFPRQPSQSTPNRQNKPYSKGPPAKDPAQTASILKTRSFKLDLNLVHVCGDDMLTMINPVPMPVQRLPKQTLHHAWAPKLGHPVMFTPVSQVHLWVMSASAPKARIACLANHLLLLNRLYEVPPPSPAALLGRRSNHAVVAGPGRANGSADDDIRQRVPPYAPSEWPHFGNDFLDYESIINRVGREFFGDTPRTSSARIPWAQDLGQLIVRAQDIDSGHATALGWWISWYGFSRTFTTSGGAPTPAIGLAGWLANAPYRPVNVSGSVWLDQMIAWLSEDLASSAWVWSRIALFMRARGNYLLHGQLTRPAVFAALRSS